MINLLFQIPQYNLFRAYGLPKKMPFSLTLNVTNRCNCKCKMCYIHANSQEELSLGELKEIFVNFGGRVRWLTFSGGEPFLRDDFDKICIEACKSLKPYVMNIPTNGMLPEAISHKIETILASCPKTNIIVNLSLDGLSGKHDEIRGVQGSFQNVIETYHRLRKLKFRNFTLGIHTALSSYNSESFPRLLGEIMNLKPDSYIVEYAQERDELNNRGKFSLLKHDEYVKCLRQLQSAQRMLKGNAMSKIIKFFRNRYYALSKKILFSNRQILPCFAGFSSAHILSNGEVWACSVNAYSMGNLRKENYNFKKIWFSPKAQKIRNSIKEKKCFCLDANINYQNMFFNCTYLFR